MKHKLLSILLSLVMVLSLLPTAALADSTGGTDAELISVINAFLETATETNHTLSLLENVEWPDETPVYWKAGSKSGFTETLQAALTAAYVDNTNGAGGITIVCKPGADVGEMTHGHVADNLTIYGNKAYISGGECDLEVDTFQYDRSSGDQSNNGSYLDKNISITAYALDNLGVWGQRHTGHTIDIKLIDCDGKGSNAQRIYIDGTGDGKAVNNITLTNCNFITAACSVKSDADGKITITNCTFNKVAEPINLKHDGTNKANYEVTNCTFNNCGSTGKDKDYAAPIRIVNGSKSASAVEVQVIGCTFEETVGTNGDILIGDGRYNRNNDNPINLTVANAGSDTTVVAQMSKYYAEDQETTHRDRVSALEVAKGESLTTGWTEMLTVAAIGDNRYTTLADAVSHAQNNDTVTLLKDAAIQNDTVSDSGAGILTIEAKNLTIDGQNHTITAVRGASATGNVSAINVENSANVTFKNLTIQGENVTRHGINVYGGTVELNSVTLKNFGGYGLEIQGTATATDLIATSNEWGGVNVDVNSLPTGNSSFVLNSGEVASVIVEHTKNDTEQTSTAEIKGGKVGAALIMNSKKPVVTLDGADLKISGGCFAYDPSNYCVEGLTGVASDDATYPWTVGSKSETKAEVATGEPAVNNPKVSYSNESDEKTLLEATQNALKESNTTVTGSGIETAAATVANKNTVTATDDVLKKLNEAMSGETAQTNNTNIVIQTYMDITITGVNADEEKWSFSVDIQPMYRTVATTADVNNDGEIVLVSDAQDSPVNAVQIGESQKLNVQAGYPVEVTIPLPSGFANDNDTLYVQHKNHEYKATVNRNSNVASFANPHGFSVFTVSKESQTVAKVGDTSYLTLQDAVNEVENGGTIEILKSGSATVSRTVSFTVKTAEGAAEGTTATITGGTRTTVTGPDANGKYTCVYSSHSSSGSSDSGSSTAYPVTVESATNGSVTTSLRSASKGDTVTLTVKADEGYLLKSLVVSDKDGAEMKLTDKGDGIYSFTMPGGKVTVSAVFAEDYGYERDYASCSKDATCPIETYADAVSAAWYHDGIHYCIQNGLMKGYDNGKFGTNDNISRGQIVTILWRLEGSPAVSGGSFDDVASDAYYAQAVAWAAENGIVGGYGNGKFGSNDPITREQFAAILYRYAQFKDVDVSVGEDTNILDFDDAQSISTYAVPAIQWACGSGMISGVSALTLDPQGVTSRAQAATMLMHYCAEIVK